MSNPTPNRPLWKVMHSAYINSGRMQEGYAAELRAIAKWISERHPIDPATGAGVGATTVVSELLAEADRAEAGE